MKLGQIKTTDVYFDYEKTNLDKTVGSAICIGKNGVNIIGDMAYSIDFLHDALKRLKGSGAEHVRLAIVGEDLLLMVDRNSPDNAVIVAPRLSADDKDTIFVDVDKRKIANLRRSIKNNSPNDIEIEIAKIGVKMVK
jgi:hypothetical protein